jgi:hypothetical protein
LEVLEALRRDELVDEHTYENRGHGSELSLDELTSQLSEIKSRYPDVLGPRDPTGGKFEAEACGIMHRTIPFDVEMLADHDFWTWMAVSQFNELVDWRHGGKERPAAPANFGIGKREENLLYRMWLRADIGYDPSRSNPYELACRGDQDFWRSHVLRQGYGKCRSLVRALIQYQFPDDSGKSTLKIPGIRELAKRLRRLHATLLFECLDEVNARQLVEREAEAAKSAVEERERLHDA